ncbi:hypothetical protein [Erwinia phage FBB1]|nr:hypothetical protein [Erwinia phage FBB1]
MKTVIKSYFGSHLYGTSTPESDVDFKEIFIPDARDVVIDNAKNHFNMDTNSASTRNTKDDIDHELFSLKYFFKLASKGETVALDMLHTPDESIVKSDLPEVWEFIKANRSRFYTTDMKAYLGYVRKQAAKYGVKGSRMAALREVVEVLNKTPDELRYLTAARKTKVNDISNTLPISEFCRWIHTKDDKGGDQVFYEVLGRKFQSSISVEMMKSSVYKLWEEYGDRARQAELNQGIDWKALSHALRGGYQLQEIYSTGDLKYPLADADILKNVKSGSLDFKIVQEELEAVVADVEILAEQARKNGMPSEVDMTFWDDFVEQVYLENIKDYYKLRG